MDFNIQTYLAEMRKEQRVDHITMTEKIDTMESKLESRLADHEGRLHDLEHVRKGVAKLIWITVGAVIVFLLDIVKDHLPRLFGK